MLRLDEEVSSASYLPWSWLSISVPNLIVILIMITLFILAIVVPFPKDRRGRRRSS